MSIGIKIRQITSSGFKRAMSSKLVKNVIIVGLNEIGDILVDTAQEGIRTSPKNYKTYFYPGVGLVKSSSPHTYPADQSGKLRRSIKREVRGYTMRFGAKAEYGKYLQQTDDPEQRAQWVKIAPRPFLSLSHNENKSKFGDIMEENFERLTK